MGRLFLIDDVADRFERGILLILCEAVVLLTELDNKAIRAFDFGDEGGVAPVYPLLAVVA